MKRVKREIILKIVKVEPIPVAYPEPNDFNAERYLCLVKITTDDGLVGWGESITQFKEANFAVAALIEGLSEFVIGRSPLENQSIWTAIKERYWWYGYRGGLAAYALSAIDIALWDLKGKALNTSLLNL
jgi:L-alanine-DL-glutamate epimerase-like enolase superfamily enzyme